MLFRSGSGYGSGDGYGYGDEIKTIHGHDVYMVDDMQTLIYSVHRNYAKGAILRKDLTLKPCFIARVGNDFAHGDTLKEAFDSATAKALQNMSIEDRIDMFVSEFKPEVKYPAMDFFKWHNTLTGSCEFGRREFASSHNINLESDEFTVKEFIELTKSSYNGVIIKQLETKYKKNEL